MQPLLRALGLAAAHVDLSDVLRLGDSVVRVGRR